MKKRSTAQRRQRRPVRTYKSVGELLDAKRRERLDACVILLNAKYNVRFK